MTDTIDIHITDEAATRIRGLLEGRDKPALGIRLGTSQKGCSGLGYTIDFVDEINEDEVLVQDKGINLYVEKASLPYINGTNMDWAEDKFSTGFVFENPNEKGRCGCGESFHV
jgi:iron-sulfur cluster assembly protein